MKIRNLPFEQLNDAEKKIVKRHWRVCMSDKGQTCFDDEKEQTVEGFWERHREVDTENGEYDGWME